MTFFKTFLTTMIFVFLAISQLQAQGFRVYLNTENIKTRIVHDPVLIKFPNHIQEVTLDRSSHSTLIIRYSLKEGDEISFSISYGLLRGKVLSEKRKIGYCIVPKIPAGAQYAELIILSKKHETFMTKKGWEKNKLAYENAPKDGKGRFGCRLSWLVPITKD